MGELRKKLEQEMIEAAKSKDKLKLSTIRMVKSAVKYKEIDIKKELDDTEIIQVLSTMLKQRADSIEAFTKGGRADLVEKEEQESEIIKKFLPPQMSVDDIKLKAKEVIQQLGASSEKELGKVMKELMPLLRGKASGKEITDIVKDLLTSS